MDFISFGSGSSGNCYYLREEDFGIVIDVGISLRTLKRAFHDHGLPMSQLRAILITHDHTDHVKAVGMLSGEFHLPVYAEPVVHKSISANHFVRSKIEPALRKPFSAGQEMQLGPFHIEAFPVPHDSAANSGFFIETPNTNFCLMTDMGSITDRMKTYIARAENLVIETNYDETMLEAGHYPPFLKARIRSDRGHSSNAQTAQALSENLTPKTKHLFLCHLSAENNHPELARKKVEAALSTLPHPPRLHVLRRSVPSDVFNL